MVGTYSFFHETDTSATDLQLKADDSPLIAFSASSTQRQDIEVWAKETQSIRLIIERLANFVGNAYRVDRQAGTQNRQPRFAELMLELALEMAKSTGSEEAEYTELHGGMFGVGKKKRENGKVRQLLAESLRSRSKSLSATIAWLDDLTRNSVNPRSNAPILKINNAAVQVELRLDSGVHADFPIFKRGDDPTRTVLEIFDDAFDDAKTESSTRNARQVIATFKQLVSPDGGGMLPVEAATAVIEMQIRALIQRRLGGSGKRAKDHEAWVGYHRTSVPLLPMKIQAPPVNHYLASFTIGSLVDKGRGRSDEELHPSDPAHPFTISGLSSANVPSPWAAAKLHSWHQIYGDARQIAEEEDQLQAILWGLFNKQLVPKSLPLRESRLGHLLTTSLDAELNGQALRDLDFLLVACDARREADVVAVNHPWVGWYPAPWLVHDADDKNPKPWWRRERFRFLLPTDAIQDGSLTRNSFALRQVRSFVNFLEGIAENHTPDTRQTAVQVPWYKTLRGLLERLRHKLDGIEPVDAREVPEHRMRLLGRKGASAGYELASMPVVVLRSSGVDIIQRYVPSYLVLLDNTEGLEPKALLCPSSPVLPDYIGKVVAKQVKLEQIEGASSYQYKVTYDLEIDGLGSERVVLPAMVKPFKTHVAIWPKFKERSWAYYYLGCQPGFALEQNNDIRFSVYDAEGKRLGKAEHRSFLTNHEISGIPAFISIEIVEGASITSRGLYEIKLEPIAEGARVFRMGLDVGTSHSSLYAIDNNDRRVPGLDFSRAKSIGLVVFNYPEKGQLFESELSFLGLFAAAEQAANQTVIPTELRVQKKTTKSEVGRAMLNDPDDPGRHFATTPMVFSHPVALMRARSDEILHDFKWRVQRNWTGKSSLNGLAGTAFEREQERVLRVYLRQLLRIGFALLRRDGFKTLQVFRATYPEAFEDTTIEKYAGVLAEVMSEVRESTGIEMALTKPLSQANLLAYRRNPVSGVNDDDSFMLSESLAAFGARDDIVAQPLMERGVCLVMDMGGGTTDVALYATEQRGANVMELASLTDSFRYAGNDILGLLVNPDVVSIVEHAIAPEQDHQSENDDYWRLMLKRAVRNGDAVAALRQAASEGAMPQAVLDAITLFFEGLIEYARLVLTPYQRQLAAEPKPITVSVVLLGNGWLLSDLRWFRGRQPAEEFMATMRRRLEAHLSNGNRTKVVVKYHATSPNGAESAVSVKESIAMGAAKFQPRLAMTAKINPLLSVPGFPLEVNVDGQLDKVEKGGFLNLAALHYSPKKLINAIDIKSTDVVSPDMRERLSKLLQVDLERLDEHLSEALRRHIEQYLNTQLHSPGPVRISPLAIFLEGLWKEVVVCTAKGVSR